MTPLEALEMAIKIAGGQVPLGEKIGASQQRISHWLTKSKRVAAPELAIKIETATGVSRHLLRPDVYPLPEKKKAGRRAA